MTQSFNCKEKQHESTIQVGDSPLVELDGARSFCLCRAGGFISPFDGVLNGILKALGQAPVIWTVQGNWMRKG